MKTYGSYEELQSANAAANPQPGSCVDNGAARYLGDTSESNNPDILVEDAKNYRNSFTKLEKAKERAHMYPLNAPDDIAGMEANLARTKEKFYDNLRVSYPELEKKIKAAQQEHIPGTVRKNAKGTVEKLKAQKAEIDKLLAEITDLEGR